MRFRCYLLRVKLNILGAHFTPSFSSGRCLFITLFLLSTLVYNYYTSLLVSALIQSSPENHIKSIDELADSKLEVGFDDITDTRIYLNVSYFCTCLICF